MRSKVFPGGRRRARVARRHRTIRVCCKEKVMEYLLPVTGLFLPGRFVMIQVLIAIDNRRVLDEGKYFSFKLKKDLCDLCLHAGSIITDPNLYLCDLDNEDLEMGCLDNIIYNLFRNPPLFDNFECSLGVLSMNGIKFSLFITPQRLIITGF